MRRVLLTPEQQKTRTEREARIYAKAAEINKNARINANYTVFNGKVTIEMTLDEFERLVAE